MSEESDATSGGEDSAPDTATDAASDADAFGDAEAAIDAARRRIVEAPPEVVVTNHVMGLYELAAIHLSSDPPNLPAAALAIDAVGCLVEGLGDRLGENAPTMRDALTNIRMAFVEIKGRAAAAS